ncbi:unnamed protein product [Chilo suppressalis]|uniref:C2H2-type domain-containing protein n=1 Tax=Chilo suppressalis TaxID=168631 RepID=A0ABN8LA35_CHISP|nr:unnamed protein product [Chilo suppressalis]
MEIDNWPLIEPQIKIEYEDTGAEDPLFVRKRDKDITKSQLFMVVESSKLPNPKSGIVEVQKPNGNWYKCIDSVGKYHCKFCELVYNSIQTLRVHTKMKHSSEALAITAAQSNIKKSRKNLCHICKEMFKSLNHLEEHLKNSHQMYKENKCCHLCHSVFDNEKVLSDHMLSAHNVQLRKMHICNTCGYVTTKRSHFNQHRDIHFGRNMRKCKYCDYETSYLPNLKIHEQLHNEKKPYSCDYTNCFYTAKSRAALRSHQLTHNKEDNFIYCDKCTYKTVYRQSLKKHLNSHMRYTVKLKP